MEGGRDRRVEGHAEELKVCILFAFLLLSPLQRHKMDTAVCRCPSECRCSSALCLVLAAHTQMHTHTRTYVQFRSIFHLLHEG